MARIKFLQEGGAAPAPMPQGPPPGAGGPPPQGGGGEEELMMMAQEALQSGDGQLALEALAGIMEMVAGASGGGAPPPPGQPVLRRGGELGLQFTGKFIR